LIGSPIPAGVDGISFQDVISYKKTKTKHESLYWEFHERGFDQALRKGKWKAIKRSSNNSKLELYDLSTDQSESYDLADRYPKIALEMEALLAKSRVDSPDYPVAKPLK
jgi:arylsulfatase A-like enzyme